jgi:hypothetical protein
MFPLHSKSIVYWLQASWKKINDTFQKWVIRFSQHCVEITGSSQCRRMNEVVRPGMKVFTMTKQSTKRWEY